MNSKKKPVVKSLSTKPKKRIVRDASPAPDLPLDGTQRKLAESALQDDREGMEKVIEKAKINEEKLVAELVIANKELNFQNKEKEKRTAELVIANKELTFQNQEKEKRAAELVIANKELILKIVERKQVEEALLGSEARYRHLLDAMLEGCQIIGFDWRYLYVNDAVAQHGHQAKEILLGHTMMEIYPGIENTELFAALQRCMKERTPQQMENEFVYPDGMKGWFELSIQPVPEGIFILSIDITERKRVDQQLKEREALLNEVGVIAKLGGWEMDITTGKATWSKGTYDIVEIDYNKPVPGLHEHVGYYLPEYREMIESKMNALIETKQPMKFEAVLKTAKGNIKWCQALGEAVVEDGKLIKLRGTFQDITERKRAEETIQNLARFPSENPNPVLRIARDGILLYRNPAALTLLKKWKLRVGKPAPEVLKTLTNEALETETTKTVDIPCGDRIFSIAIAPAPEGEYINLYARDVTERTQMEEALASSEQFLSSVIEQIPGSLWISDSEGTMIKMNQACRELFGVTDEEAVGKYNLLKDNLIEAQGFMTLVRDVFEKGEIARFTIDYDVPRVEHIEVKEGTHRILDVVISPIKDMHGKLTNVLVQHKDITERKQAQDEILRLNTELEQRVSDRTAQLQTANRQLESELNERKSAQEALWESDERFRSLSGAAFEAISIHDGGVLLDANEQYYAMFGYKPEELLGKQVMTLTIAPEAMETVKKEIATGGVGPYESTGLRKDGTRLPMEIRVRELEYKERKVRVAAIMDITDRKRAEQALQQRTAQLEVANQELEAFSYSVSHDLRAPLRAMDGFSAALLTGYSDKLDERGHHYLDRIRDASQRMGQLIEDLLNLSRITRSTLNRQPVDLSALAQEVAVELQKRDPQRQVEFVIAEKMTLEADPHLLRIVMQNLLDNAWKFTSPRPQAVIEIGWESIKSSEPSHTTGCIYFVKDNGVGFDMAYIDKLFVPFQRLHSLYEFPGTGIGLATVQRIVHRHGGGAWAEAQLDKGATFYFTLGGPNA